MDNIFKQAVKKQFQLYQSPEWRAGFISGAKWADKTMLDRSCDKNHLTFSDELVNIGYRRGRLDTINEITRWLNSINTDNYMDSSVFQMCDLIRDLHNTIQYK